MRGVKRADDLDLERVAGEAAAAHGGEAAEVAGVVRPCLGLGERGERALRRRRSAPGCTCARPARCAGARAAWDRRAWRGAGGTRACRRRARRASRRRCRARGARRRGRPRANHGPIRRAAPVSSCSRSSVPRGVCALSRIRSRKNARWKASTSGACRRRLWPSWCQRVARITKASRRSSTSRSSGQPGVVGGVEEVRHPARRRRAR